MKYSLWTRFIVVTGFMCGCDRHLTDDKKVTMYRVLAKTWLFKGRE